jgi:hypothetical protein
MTRIDPMPAMPFGDMTANFDVVRRERIEREKDRIRTGMSDLETLVTGWEQEAQSRNDDVPMVVAVRAMEYERGRLLDDLEPLHDDVVKVIERLTSSGASRYRDVSERVRAWVPDRRADPAQLRDRAMGIVDTLQTETHRLPKPHELATIQQALKLIR